MKKSYSVTIGTYERVQPTLEEVHAAIRELMLRKVEESDPRRKPSFIVDVVTDFSRK